MKNELIAKKSEYFLDNYLSSKEIYCLKRSKIDNNSVLVLPNKYSEANYYYASESMNLAKYLQVYEHFGSIDFLDNENLNVRDLHSFDIWLGTLYVVNHLLVPIILGIDYVGTFVPHVSLEQCQSFRSDCATHFG